METKVCSRCGIEKPITEYYWGNRRCKSCIAEYHKEWRKQEFTEKLCPRCKKVVLRSGWADYGASYCIDCTHESQKEKREQYNKDNPSEPYKARKRKTPEELRATARERERKYQQSENGKATKKEWRNSINGKLCTQASLSLHSMKYPERKAATLAVGLAVRSGQLIRQEHCEICDSTEKVEAHHHMGYDLEHWFHVRWLCRSCHLKEHNGTTASSEE